MAVADILLSSSKEKLHEVIYKHPAQKDSSQMHQILFETEAKEFYMDVASVYCFEDVCKIDTIRIYWNRIGKYQRFELQAGIALEKANGELFTDQDYKKLHFILNEEDSPFKNIRIESIISTQGAEHSDVDGYSGATAIELDESVSIQGAVLTSYTLWHWANGDLVKQIRKITGEATNADDLLTYLRNSEADYKLFALEQLMVRKNFEARLIEEIKEQYKGNCLPLKRNIISYLESAPKEIYQNVMLDLFKSEDSKQRITCLQSLLHTNSNLSSDAYSKLYRQLNNMETYQEVDLFLSLLEKQSQELEARIAPLYSLLANSNILISRRAFWFLERKNASKEQQKLLNDFAKKNKDYL
ncbi:hypothetical protein BZG02_16220 [Labilibaculum filiforme]|uniref:Uncharacterized protein n=1 Tax=Labilibaculum filiforme TaxID=1940526 RepID=A0A2N3HTE5_9BACT|nr:hypothetical protein [Labilibaculum filiforme]PKQ61335.1 hypothetical protein BZG02_16220 [Labilibaculum filiforme]